MSDTFRSVIRFISNVFGKKNSINHQFEFGDQFGDIDGYCFCLWLKLKEIPYKLNAAQGFEVRMDGENLTFTQDLQIVLERDENFMESNTFHTSILTHLQNLQWAIQQLGAPNGNLGLAYNMEYVSLNYFPLTLDFDNCLFHNQLTCFEIMAYALIKFSDNSENGNISFLTLTYIPLIVFLAKFEFLYKI